MADPSDVPAFAKILENGDIALGFFNFSDTDVYSRYVTLDMLGLDADRPIKCTVKDLWSKEEITPINDAIKVEKLDAHCCRLFRICVETV
jgi:hypothetical protein